MDIAWMFRPALDKITLSIPSAGNYGIITRVLSLTGSFNDRTSLLLDDAGPEQAGQRGGGAAAPTQAQDHQAAAPPSATTAVHAFDIEATTPLQAAGSEPAAVVQDAKSKRVAKSVQTVCLFAASASLVLFVNRPSMVDAPSQSKQPPAAGAGALYSAGLAFISLGFFSSLGLSMFSIVARPGEAAVARVQKWGMVVSVASVLVAFTLRMCLMV